MQINPSPSVVPATSGLLAGIQRFWANRLLLRATQSGDMKDFDRALSLGADPTMLA